MKKYDQQLERLHELKSEPVTAALIAEVRKALSNKSNFLVGKAAGVAAHHRLTDLIADLIAAFTRFLGDSAVKADPQCWAKNGIAKALVEIGHDDPDVYLAGLRHVQPEPVWGGVEDTAGPLRAQCALALVQCRTVSDQKLLSYLVHTLVDRDKTVRMEAARAIGQMSRAEASLLLRLKALTGDEDAEVTGACLAAVLAVDREGALDFVKPFLEADGDLAAEAALALGLARIPEAVPLLTSRYERERDRSLASVMLTALAVSQQPEAAKFLLSVIEEESADRALAAIGAMAQARMSGEGVIEAASRNPDPRVAASARQSFLPPLSSA